MLVITARQSEWSKQEGRENRNNIKCGDSSHQNVANRHISFARGKQQYDESPHWLEYDTNKNVIKRHIKGGDATLETAEQSLHRNVIKRHILAGNTYVIKHHIPSNITM